MTARADDLVGVGDSVAVLNGQTFDLGNVACNADSTKQIVVAVNRAQGGGNAYASSATVSLSGTGSSGVTVTPSSQTITLPSTWKANGTVSASRTFTATIHPSTQGAGTGTVTIVGSGSSDATGPLTRTATVNLKWSTTGCIASTNVALSCPTSITYTGAALTPCSAVVTGGGLSQSVPVRYSANTNSGPVTASASFAGDSTHSPSAATATFQIAKAGSTVSLSCNDVTYNGTDQTPCTAEVTGAGGLKQDVAVSYQDNHDAGTATAAAAYSGDSNHLASTSGTKHFSIFPATSTVIVKCELDSVTYTGDAQNLCNASVTGAGGLNQTLPVTYDDNTNAGTVTASATYAGDKNHTSATSSSTFSIKAAASAVSIDCTTTTAITYDGTAHDACTAEVTGAGGLKKLVPVTYDDNTNAGTVTVTASYAGDNNHDASASTTSFTIAKAQPKVIVSCTGPITYDGTAHAPCTAEVTGPAGLKQTLTVTYTKNTNAGTATATAAYTESGNYLGAADTTTFQIDQATSTTTVTCPVAAVQYTGTALRPCSATVAGSGTIDQTAQVIYVYSNNTKAGQANVVATWPGDTNHTGSFGNASFAIAPWTLSGFDKPVDMSTQSTTVWNTVKGGSTVPLKFTATAYGRAITTVAELGASFSVTGVTCPGSNAVTATVEFVTTGGTDLRYSSGQFIQNWQTPKSAGGCYKTQLTTADGSTVSAWFMTK